MRHVIAAMIQSGTIEPTDPERSVRIKPQRARARRRGLRGVRRPAA